MNVPEIICNVENNCEAHVVVDQDPDSEPGWYIVESQAIGVSVHQSDIEAIASIVHEVAHHVDIVENNHPDRRDIDGEIIAHAVEGIIVSNEPIQGIIEEYEEDVREAYICNGVVSIDEDDIQQVVDRVRAIISN